MKSIFLLFLSFFLLQMLNPTLQVVLRNKIKQKSTEKLKIYKGDPEVEGCVACRMIWENIEEALGEDSRNSILAAEAFQYFCKISPDIFFTPCNDMFQQLFDMSENFAIKKMNHDALCKKAKMCPDS